MIRYIVLVRSFCFGWYGLVKPQYGDSVQDGLGYRSLGGFAPLDLPMYGLVTPQYEDCVQDGLATTQDG